MMLLLYFLLLLRSVQDSVMLTKFLKKITSFLSFSFCLGFLRALAPYLGL